MLRISLTGYCISVTVASNFPAVSFSRLLWGLAIFHFYTGIGFIPIIADGLSASSFLIESGRYNRSKFQCFALSLPEGCVFSIPVPCKTYGCFLYFFEPVVAFPLLLPTVSEQFPCHLRQIRQLFSFLPELASILPLLA